MKRHTPPANEGEIQNTLYFDCIQKGRRSVVPNTFAIFGWESDLLAITQSAYAHCYEIKISRSDFRRDIRTVPNTPKHYRKEVLSCERTPEGRLTKPNYFWFAAPPGLLSIDDMPDYAGLVEVDKRVCIVKKAPLLHKEKLTLDYFASLTTALTARYWNQRFQAENGKRMADWTVDSFNSQLSSGSGD